MRKTFYAVHGGHVVPCHLVARQDRDERGPYAADSKRDKRRFQTAYGSLAEARDEAARIQQYRSQPDTF